MYVLIVWFLSAVFIIQQTDRKLCIYNLCVCESSESFCVMVFLFVWQSLPQNAVAVHFRRRRVLVLDLKICSRALLSKDVSKLWLSLKLCDFPTFPGGKQQGICLLVSSVALVSNVYSGPIQTEYIAVYFIYHRLFFFFRFQAILPFDRSTNDARLTWVCPTRWLTRAGR